jgi:cytochrome c-type biogenesis protein CcmE
VPYRKFVWPALAVVAAVVVSLIALNLNGSLTYYLTPSEAIDRRADFAGGERFRLGGLVVEGSVEDLDGVKVFDVTDGAEDITVRLRGSVPPLFSENVGVVVEGAWSGSEFAADLALVRHDENYQPPSTAAPG